MPSLEDHESRLRHVEGLAAENRWRLDGCENAVKKTAELLERVETQVEHMEWAREQSAATVSRRQAFIAAVVVAVCSPAVSAGLTYWLSR